MGSTKAAICSVLTLVIAASFARAQESITDMLAEEDPALQEIEAQIEAREYDYPILWLEQHVEAVQRASHRYAPELIRPLTLLGDAKAGKGDFGSALDQYQRAVHLSRVNDGLNATSQIHIVYREAEAYKAIGDYEKANDREEYAYHVLISSHQPYDEDMLPGIYHLAAWYRETHNIFSARALYQHAINILSANGKHTSELAIPAYQGIAESYRFERFPPYYMPDANESMSKSRFSSSYSSHISVNNLPAGERALQKIIQIHREDPDHDPVVLAEAILDLADWYLLFDKISRANPLYEHVYKLLEEVAAITATEYFAEPKLLYFPVPEDPRAPPLPKRGKMKQGFVEVVYDISKTGYPRELATVSSEPHGLMDSRVRKSLRVSRYRPSIVEGVPINRADHIYRHEFAYYPKLEVDETAEAASDEGA
jgi:tetratricopeptide (TPR) repeat protein